MKQHDKDTFNELFAAQAKLQDNVNVYNVVESIGDPIHLKNTLLLMGGDPRPKLQEMNNYINQCLTSFENRVESQRSENAQKQVEINNLRKQANEIRESHSYQQQYINNKKIEDDTLNVKMKASTELLQDKKLQLQKAQEDNVDYIQSMSLKQRSFVLQKALTTKSDDIIKLMEKVELDADFRNGDGVSLMQTAIEVGHERIIDKLKPLTSEESYHPPKEVMDIANILPKTECFQTTLLEEKKESNNVSIVEKHSTLEQFLKVPMEHDYLDLSNQNITDEDCFELSSILLKNNIKNIKFLHLNNNQITDKGISALADGLEGNNLITSFYIQNNKIGNIGIIKLLKILKGMKNLSDFGLNDNQIGKEGASALVEELKGNECPLKLWIANNNLGDEGTIVLARNLKDMNISNLGLAKNNITDVGAKVLIDEISNSVITTNLYLAHNYISPEYVLLMKNELSHLSYTGLNGQISDVKENIKKEINTVKSLYNEGFDKQEIFKDICFLTEGNLNYISEHLDDTASVILGDLDINYSDIL
jgi:hypothetical protein